MNGKIKWTVIDTLIVAAVVVAGFAVFKVFGGKIDIGEKKTIEAIVLLAEEDPEVVEAIKNSDPKVTVSLTEKDSGELKGIEVEDAKKLVFNTIDGEWVNETVEGKVDIYATVKLEVTETDYAYTTGSTFVKVGEEMPFRGKGYALEGFVISVVETEE